MWQNWRHYDKKSFSVSIVPCHFAFCLIGAHVVSADWAQRVETLLLLFAAQDVGMDAAVGDTGTARS